jgi:hypothetical protein
MELINKHSLTFIQAIDGSNKSIEKTYNDIGRIWLYIKSDSVKINSKAIPKKTKGRILLADNFLLQTIDFCGSSKGSELLEEYFIIDLRNAINRLDLTTYPSNMEYNFTLLQKFIEDKEDSDPSSSAEPFDLQNHIFKGKYYLLWQELWDDYLSVARDAEFDYVFRIMSGEDYKFIHARPIPFLEWCREKDYITDNKDKIKTLHTIGDHQMKMQNFKRVLNNFKERDLA